MTLAVLPSPNFTGADLAARLNAGLLELRAGRRFATLAALIADTTLAYGAGARAVSAGDIVEAGGHRYEVAGSGATDAHLTTAGGVNLYVADRMPSDAFGFSPPAALAGDTLPLLQAMADYQARGRLLTDPDPSPWRLLANRLWQHVQHGIDFSLIVKGDSTGNASDEWVYLLAGLLGRACPTHSVKYRLYTDGVGWGADQSITTGTGTAVIYIHNASHPGATDRYFQGSAAATVDSLTPAGGYHGQIVSFGHNGGAVASFTEAVWSGFHTEGLVAFKAKHPAAVLVATQQNPRNGTSTVNEVSRNSHRAMANACRTLGVGMLSVSDAFLSLGDFSGLMADDTHPNAQGMKLWAGLAFLALRRPARLSAEDGQRDHFFWGRNLLRNGNLSVPAVEGSPTPAGWSTTGVTLTRDATHTDLGPWAIKLVSDGSALSPTFRQFLGAEEVKRLRGKWVTLLARARYGSAAAARLQIIDSGASSSNRSPNGTEGQGAFCYMLVQHQVSANATSLELRYLCGAANVAGSTAYLDFMTLAEGLVPALPDYAREAPKGDYLFNSANTGVVAAYDGTLSVSGDDVTISGQTATTRWYLNLPALPAGTRLRASWVGADVSNAAARTVYAREGVAGGGLTQASCQGRRGELTFHATGAAMCLMFEISGTTAETFKDLRVEFA